MNKDIISAIVDLLKPINKEDFNNLSMGIRKEIAHVEVKVDQVGSELNNVQQYLRRHNFRIFNAPVTEIANKEVFGWTFKYFTH